MNLGLDLGSRYVKIVCMEDNQITQVNKYDTIRFYREFGRKAGDELVIDFTKLEIPRAEKIVSTGYGRNTINLKGASVISELKAHTLGAVYQTGLQDFTLLDLGGQDTKVIKVRKGKMVDFITNDKCAASSGRYLENMAAVLGVDIGELGRYSRNPVELNSTCAIFGESELIGKILEGHDIASLCAGVNNTIVKRVLPMLRGMASEVLVFTGGVAYSQGVRKLFAEQTGLQIVIPAHPQYNGAIGCCVYGGEGNP